MKGLVFTELVSMAEFSIGEQEVDRLLSRCPLASGGAYTSVGRYPFEEFRSLVAELSRATGLSPERLQYMFGEWMHDYFVGEHGAFYDAKQNAFDMLESIEDEVHAEVRKLHSDAELPRFVTRRPSPHTLVFEYHSPKALVHFCHALIVKCLEHYRETAFVRCEPAAPGDQPAAVFTVILNNGVH